ncbi:GNAT family N-acetyltransferase, partial [Clostridium tarantellae]
MIFTELQKKHIKNLLDLVWKVFKEFNGKDCSEEGIEEFKNFIEYECVLERFYKGELKFYGAIDNDNLIGVIATKNINHICLLFIDKNYHKKGIGKKLFKMVEDVCKTKNIIKITVNSSPYSVSFYKKIGFTVKNKEKTINGIRFIPMEYLINNISLKLFTYLKAKEKNCNIMLKDNYENNEKNLKEIKNIINIVQKVKKYLNLYILNEKKLNEKNLLKLLDYLIIISKDN